MQGYAGPLWMYQACRVHELMLHMWTVLVHRDSRVSYATLYHTQLRHVRIKFSEGEQFIFAPQVFISTSLDTSKETSIETNQQKTKQLYVHISFWECWIKQHKWPNMLLENRGNENEGYKIVHLFIQKDECGVQIFQKRKKYCWNIWL